jgi:hypothetical protein
VAGSRAEIASGLLQLMANAVQTVRDGDCEPRDIRLRTWTDDDGSAAVEVSAGSTCCAPALGAQAGGAGDVACLETARGGERVVASATSCEAAFQLRLAPFAAPAGAGPLRLR